MTWKSASGGHFDPEFHQTCDDCGEPGHSDSGGFTFADGVVNGPVICLQCQQKRDDKRVGASRAREETAK